MHIYLSGPMRGIKAFNFPAFDHATRILRNAGHTVFNPAEKDRENGFDATGMTGNEDLAREGFDLRTALGEDLDWICQHAHVVATLPGSDESAGATAEIATAIALGLPVVPWDDVYLDSGRNKGYVLPTIAELRQRLQARTGTYAGRPVTFDEGVRIDHADTIPADTVYMPGEEDGDYPTDPARVGCRGECDPWTCAACRAKDDDETLEDYSDRMRAKFTPEHVMDISAKLSGETRTTSATGAEKGVKLAAFDLIPMEALTKVATHYGIGARKYAAHNWRAGYEWSKSFAAMQRHATQFWAGEDMDTETGSPHMAAVAFHALTLLTF